MALSDWSTTAGSNTSVGGISIAEDCPAGNLNNALREMMAQIKTKFDAVDATTGAPASITALAALTPAADRLPYFIGPTAAALATLTSAARSLLDDADADTMLATLGAVKAVNLVTGGNGTLSLKLGATPIMIQWGVQAGSYTEGQVSVYFNSGFATSCWWAFPYPVVASADSTNDYWVQLIGTPLSGYFDAMVQKSGGSPAGLSGIGWLAIGN